MRVAHAGRSVYLDGQWTLSGSARLLYPANRVRGRVISISSWVQNSGENLLTVAFSTGSEYSAMLLPAREKIEPLIFAAASVHR